MTATSLVSSGGSNLDLYSYTYNVGNQRTAVERGGENTAAYTYDAIGQVIADQATEVSGGTTRLNEQLRYGFDPAGNLNYRTNNALVGNFQVNTLNELTANTNGGTLTVMGTTTSPATTVAVNGTNAAHYNDATFAATNMPLTTTYTATASDSLGRSATNTVTVSIAASTTFQYDGNGNLTNDGLRNFAYDDENQLIQVWVTNQYFSQFTYDGKMRRRIRQEYAWQGGAWVQTNEVYYVYDGNEVIQERDLNNLPVTTYTRGKDLSGSLEGAGGIGGLLSMTLNSALGTSSSNSMVYHADGNGNITMLINSSQSIVAKYLYDAFGNVLSKSGLLADANLYRFSSKESHQNSGLVYYLYRYYDPNLQRWPNRDPIGDEAILRQASMMVPRIAADMLRLEAQGNLFEFNYNNPEGYVDKNGHELVIEAPIAIAVVAAITYAACMAIPSCRAILQRAGQGIANACPAPAAPTPCTLTSGTASGWQNNDSTCVYNCGGKTFVREISGGGGSCPDYGVDTGSLPGIPHPILR